MQNGAGVKGAAEKGQNPVRPAEDQGTGAKARLIYQRLAAWLKSGPYYKAVGLRVEVEFFRRL